MWHRHILALVGSSFGRELEVHLHLDPRDLYIGVSVDRDLKPAQDSAGNHGYAPMVTVWLALFPGISLEIVVIDPAKIRWETPEPEAVETIYNTPRQPIDSGKLN